MNKYLVYLVLASVPFLIIVISDIIAGALNILSKDFFAVFFQFFSIYVIALVIILFFKPNVWFLTATALNFPFFYLLHQFSIKFNNLHDNGLGILAYAFSLPGLFIGLLIAAIFYKKLNLEYRKLHSFLIAVFFPLIGFLINYLIVCNSLAYCGCFSFIK